MSQQSRISSVYIHHSSNVSAQQRMWRSQAASQNMLKNLLSIGLSLSSKVFLGLKKIRFKRIIEIEGMATLACSGAGEIVEINTEPWSYWTMVYSTLEYRLELPAVKGKGGVELICFFPPSSHQWDFCYMVPQNTTWILTHNSLIHISDGFFHSLVFCLTTEVWFCDVNQHQKIFYLCYPLIYRAWNYHSAWISAQQKSLCSLSDLAQIHLMPCKSHGLAWPEDGWCEALATSLSFIINTGSSTHQLQVPSAAKHAASQRGELGCFPNTAPSALFQCTTVN